MAKVTVVVVNYNAGEVILECLKKVFLSLIELQCIVIDNASADGSLLEIQKKYADDVRVKIVANDENTGFAAGCNQGLRLANTEYILFLNPDCFVDENTIESVLSALDKNSQAGMAGCLIHGSNGVEQRGCRRRFPTLLTSLMRLTGLCKIFPQQCQEFDLINTNLPSGPVVVDAISGAFMLVKQAALNDVGVFDEGYWLYGEDLDLCKRFQLKCWDVLFVPTITVQHIGGVCGKKIHNKIIWHQHRGIGRYYYKYYWQKMPKSLSLGVMSVIYLRFIFVLMVKNVKRWVHGR
jgi:GT2 family glycosyltransferase